MVNLIDIPTDAPIDIRIDILTVMARRVKLLVVMVLEQAVGPTWAEGHG